MKYLIPSVASFLLTVVITPLIIRLAVAYKCMDEPGGRRLHARSTPRWGGIAFFAGVLPFLFIENVTGTLTAYIVAASLLVIMGMVDDLTSLGWKSKFAVMGVATFIVIYGGDVTIHQIGTYGSIGELDLGILSVPFTFVSIIGITNAINLLDGLNGLAGGVSLLGFLFMGIAATLAGNIMLAVICFAFVGAIAAFLIFNFPDARIFMGDTGSLFLGFSLAVTAVLLTQGGSSAVDAMFPALVLLIPIFDTLRVLIVRLLNGRNPFKADDLHLHYLLVQRDISPVTVTLIFWLVTSVLGGIALFLTDFKSLPYLYALLFASSLLYLGAITLMQRHPIRNLDRFIRSKLSVTEKPSTAPPRYYNPYPAASSRGGTMLFKLIVAMGVVLLAAQAIAE